MGKNKDKLDDLIEQTNPDSGVPVVLEETFLQEVQKKLEAEGDYIPQGPIVDKPEVDAGKEDVTQEAVTTITAEKAPKGKDFVHSSGRPDHHQLFLTGYEHYR